MASTIHGPTVGFIGFQRQLGKIKVSPSWDETKKKNSMKNCCPRRSRMKAILVAASSSQSIELDVETGEIHHHGEKEGPPS